jgi:hypothetical protein
MTKRSKEERAQIEQQRREAKKKKEQSVDMTMQYNRFA